jgi:hypothetical protein
LFTLFRIRIIRITALASLKETFTADEAEGTFFSRGDSRGDVAAAGEAKAGEGRAGTGGGCSCPFEFEVEVGEVAAL